MVQFAYVGRVDSREILLRLKNGSAQDDADADFFGWNSYRRTAARPFDSGHRRFYANSMFFYDTASAMGCCRPAPACG
jgi:hypothetical protein